MYVDVVRNVHLGDKGLGKTDGYNFCRKGHLKTRSMLTVRATRKTEVSDRAG